MLHESEFKKVDDIVEWCEEQGFEWTEVYKYQKVNARKAKPGEKVQTKLKDGTKETDERVAGKGDWIVSNVDGGGEAWIVTDKNFQKKYEAAGKDGVYKPKGAPMTAAKLPVSVEFKPPMWGGDVQRIAKGGWLLRDKQNEEDIYGIGEEEFRDTYKAVGGKKLEESSRVLTESFKNMVLGWLGMRSNRTDIEDIIDDCIKRPQNAERRNRRKLIKLMNEFLWDESVRDHKKFLLQRARSQSGANAIKNYYESTREEILVALRRRITGDKYKNNKKRYDVLVSLLAEAFTAMVAPEFKELAQHAYRQHQHELEALADANHEYNRGRMSKDEVKQLHSYYDEQHY